MGAPVADPCSHHQGVGALNPASPEYQFLLGYGCSVVFNPFFNKLSEVQS